MFFSGALFAEELFFELAQDYSKEESEFGKYCWCTAVVGNILKYHWILL